MAVSNELGAERTRDLRAGTIAYRERGAGRPLVFVHGALVNGDLWREVVPVLAGDFRCITPDWPLGSHTLPMKPDADLKPDDLARLIAEFIEELDLRDVVLVASDTGGALAQITIANHPERIGALVLTNCDAFENFFPPALRPLTYLAPVPGFVDGLAFALRSPLLQRAVAATVAHRKGQPAIMQSYFRPLIADAGVRRDARKVFAAVRASYTLEAARTFGAFEKPVGIGWGEDDHLFFPLRYAARLRDAFPNARLQTFRGARTLVPEDAPGPLAALIAEIARDVTASDASRAAPGETSEVRTKDSVAS
jgi:pimeloyl-ACP methyl ester carboxylesterase